MCCAFCDITVIYSCSSNHEQFYQNSTFLLFMFEIIIVETLRLQHSFPLFNHHVIKMVERLSLRDYVIILREIIPKSKFKCDVSVCMHG